MDIRGSLDGLKSLLGTGATQQTPSTQGQRLNSTGAAGQVTADSATLSSAGSQVSASAGEPGVRMDKVAAIQAQLAAGSYQVPASALASRLVDSMLGARA